MKITVVWDRDKDPIVTWELGALGDWTKIEGRVEDGIIKVIVERQVNKLAEAII